METLKSFRKQVSQSRKRRGESYNAEKSRKGALLLRNNFVFHVRGFRCCQNQVLSTSGKLSTSAQCKKSRKRLAKRGKKLVIVIVGLCS